MLYNHLAQLWGACTVDRFSTALNAQVPRFNGVGGESGAEAVDAFAQPVDQWRQEVNWCVPPLHLLPQLAQFLRDYGVGAVVLAPDWPAQAWHQALRSLACSTLHFTAQQAPFLASPHCEPGPSGPGRWAAVAFHIPDRQAITGRD